MKGGGRSRQPHPPPVCSRASTASASAERQFGPHMASRTSRGRGGRWGRREVDDDGGKEEEEAEPELEGGLSPLPTAAKSDRHHAERRARALPLGGGGARPLRWSTLFLSRSLLLCARVAASFVPAPTPPPPPPPSRPGAGASPRIRHVSASSRRRSRSGRPARMAEAAGPSGRRGEPDQSRYRSERHGGGGGIGGTGGGAPPPYPSSSKTYTGSMAGVGEVGE